MMVDDPLNEVFLPPPEDTTASVLSDATATLQLEDQPPLPETSPVPQHITPQHEYPDLHIEMPSIAPSLPELPIPNTPTTPSSTPCTPLAGEKKKKVSLADYRKRLQSRTPKSESHSSDNVILESSEARPSSDKENSSPAVPPPEHPVFEPISPDVSHSVPGSSLIDEFTKPSLSESMSLDSIQPRKLRKVESESEDPGQIQKLCYQIKEATAPLRHDVNPTYSNGSVENSPGAIDDATISKIKEILYNSNPSLKVNSSRSPSPKIKPPRLEPSEESEFNNGANPALSDNLLRSCIDDSRLRYQFGESQKELKSLNDGVQHNSTTYNTLPGNTFNRWDSR